MAWFWRFAAVCTAAILGTAGAVAMGLWWFGEFSPGELGLHGVLSLALGIAMSAVVGVGLMALVFFSARRGRDDIGAAGGGDAASAP
jgi:hypothetical protein